MMFIIYLIDLIKYIFHIFDVHFVLNNNRYATGCVGV